jgi:Leucine-rich repeat (LRR) protein
MHTNGIHLAAAIRPHAVATLLALAALGSATPTLAAIPDSERAALIVFYTSTNGALWLDHGGWLGSPGTECEWRGIRCASGANVESIELPSNQLSGTLPSLSAFPMLSEFDLSNNALQGVIPPLSTLTHLGFFDVSSNLLTGQLPSLTGLANLQTFYASDNRLTGSIPSLYGLTQLNFFRVHTNQLSGSLPSLAGMANLRGFNARSNQLTGLIPPLTGLGNLSTFRVSNNQLSGPVPSLAGMPYLEIFLVDTNMLSGSIPAAPSRLGAGASRLCPNAFTPIANAAWDMATGETPWYQNCAPLPDPVFHSGFD